MIAGVITGDIQGELGHLAIRTARRGTPNAYVRNPAQAFAAFNGKLVRLSVESIGYQVKEGTLAEAEAWWAAHRPKLGEIPEVDVAYDRLDAAWEPPIDGSVRLITRYGGKGSNFARLYQLLKNPQNRVPGFLIPFHFYLKFMETNLTYAPRDPTRKVTYAKYIEELLADPEFRGNSERRFQDLERLREIIEDNGLVDEADVQLIARRVQEIYGRTDKKVRFRSSSNVEDLLEFNGAGLYTSTGGCAGDDLDGDSTGPSVCDAFDLKEDGVAKSLKRVWASLWNYRAFEEREYYQIPHVKTRMAVLSSEAFPDEAANGVAFTGNPSLKGDRRFLINAQLGDIEVVFPDPGVVPEKDVLELTDGKVTNILRVRASTLVPAGEVVVSDAILREMGEVMSDIESRLPVELGTHTKDEVVLDFEFKVDTQNRLRFKQVRPFLISDSGTSAPQYTLQVPQGLVACGSFLERRPAMEVYQTKAQIGLREGDHLLRTDGPSSANLIEWVQLGPNGPQIPAAAPGVWSVILNTSGADPVFECNMSQKFVLPDNSPFWVMVVNFIVTVNGPREIAFDADAVTWSINPYIMHIGLNFGPEPDFRDHKWFLPCNLDHLNLYFVDALFTNGDSAHFFERFQDVRDGTGPAELVGAMVSLGGTDISVNDYWRLVYTAGHHNETPRPEHWAIFDEVLDLPGVGKVKGLGVSEGFAGEKPRAFYLAEDLSELKPLEIGTFRRRKEGDPLKSEFRRGDVDMSGKVNLTDAILILRYNFYGDTIRCVDAGDVDDIGTAGVDDAILLLGYLFFGLDAPTDPGPAHCGEDVVPDELPDCEPGACQ